jgi:hypothetical protein
LEEAEEEDDSVEVDADELKEVKGDAPKAETPKAVMPTLPIVSSVTEIDASRGDQKRRVTAASRQADDDGDADADADDAEEGGAEWQRGHSVVEVRSVRANASSAQYLQSTSHISQHDDTFSADLTAWWMHTERRQTYGRSW